jgi:hypothetical protein
MSRNLNRLFEQPWMQINRQIQRQNEYLRHIIDGQAQRLARDIQELYKRMNPDWAALINSGMFDAMQRIQQSSKAVVDSAALRAFENQTEIWRRLINLPTEKLIETDRQYQQLMNSISMPALHAISNEAILYFQSASASSRFPESFVGQMLDHLQSIADLETAEDVEVAAAKLEGLFNQRVSVLRRDFITREGMIQMLLALVILWYQMYQGVKTEQRIIDVISQTESRLLERIETLSPPESKELFYMVLHRGAQLRAHPSMKRPIVEKLYPHQRVSLLATKGKWIHVKFFSYVDGVPKSGWALKKYLKRIDRIKAARTPTPKSRAQFGSGKGLIKLSDDFDEPLKDFEQYS